MKQFSAKHVSVAVLAVIWALYQIMTVIVPDLMHVREHRAIHLCFALILVWLLKSTVTKKKGIDVALNVLMILATVGITGYLIANATRFEMRPYGYSMLDGIVAVIGILVVLEATRRVMGWSLVIVAAVFIGYGLFGNLIPGKLGHSGGTLFDVANRLMYSIDGVYGSILGISATLIFIYLLFGGFLLVLGGGEFFTKLAYAAVGSTRGGAAKVAVLASAFFGSISGSAISNVVTTGTVTIPLMRKLGFKPEFAGAVEAVASTGGQILPPVMGATAFVMANVMGVSYFDVVVAAALPAIFYFVAILFMVDFEAAKMGIKGIPREELPKMKDVLKEGWHFFIPFIVLIYLLMVLRWEAQTAGIYAVFSMILVQLIRQPKLSSIKKIFEGLKEGASSAITVAVPCATVGIIVGIVVSTGVGLSFTAIVRSLAGEGIFALLFVMMIASLIIGMGVPTTAAYVMLAVLMVPTLIDLGVVPMAAHMFALYFGILSVVTPPVALAAYTAAGIAQSNASKTGFRAFFLALSGFIIPYIFVYQPGLLLMGDAMEIFVAIVTTAVGIISLSGVVQNYFFGNINLVLRVLLLVGCITVIFPHYWMLGLATIVIVSLVQFVRHRRNLSATGAGS